MGLDSQEYDICILDGFQIIGGDTDAILLLQALTSLVGGVGCDDILRLDQAGRNDAADDGAAHVAAANKCNGLVHKNHSSFFLYDFIRVFNSATVSIPQLLFPFNHSPDSL